MAMDPADVDLIAGRVLQALGPSIIDLLVEVHALSATFVGLHPELQARLLLSRSRIQPVFAAAKERIQKLDAALLDELLREIESLDPDAT